MDPILPADNGVVEDAPMEDAVDSPCTPEVNPAADDDAMSTTSTEDEDKEGDKESLSPEEAEILLLKATGLKEDGNGDFQRGEWTKAARSYRRAVTHLKKLNQQNTGDDQVKALLVSLYTNLSTVHYKTAQYRVSAQLAAEAIALAATPATHVKALYRRAVAQRKRGDAAAARVDLKAALAIDASNTACQKELHAVKQQLEREKTTQQQKLAKAFAKGGASLYDDKEQEAMKKVEAERRKKEKEEEEKKSRKQEWEDACVKRMAKGEEAITFEDWEKEREAKIKAEREAKEAEKKAAEKKRREQQRAMRKNTANNDDDDDDELTPEECKMLRGYKKTADGRTTSYFTREISHNDTQLIGNTAPKRIESTGDDSTTANQNSAASKWNQAGTWEEKDTTTWCNSNLEKHLLETIATSEDGHDIDVTKVESLSGHASVAVVAGKKRYIFDFDAKLKYEIKQQDDKMTIAEGVVHLPDINSTIRMEEIEVLFNEGWKKKPSADQLGKAMLMRGKLEAALRAQVQCFVQEFNSLH